MVGIAIIGCGSITRVRHAPECQKNENIKLCGFFDINQERCQEFADSYQCKAYATLEDALTDPEVDGVIICTANKYHCDTALQAFAHGKHVMCEKPIAVTSAEAQSMIDAAEKAGKYLMIAHNQRFEPINQKIKEILNSGVMGRIICFRTAFGHSGPENWSVDKGKSTWFLNKNQAGLGAMGDLGIHRADLIHWLINDDIKYVTAKVCTLDKRTPDGELISLDDNAFCILESESGITGVLEASWTHNGKVSDTTYLYCENGIIEAIGGTSQPITVRMKDGSSYSMSVARKASGMSEAFANCILNNQPPELDGKQGKIALDIVLRCIESSEKNTRLAL